MGQSGQATLAKFAELHPVLSIFCLQLKLVVRVSNAAKESVHKSMDGPECGQSRVSNLRATGLCEKRTHTRTEREHKMEPGLELLMFSL